MGIAEPIAVEMPNAVAAVAAVVTAVVVAADAAAKFWPASAMRRNLGPLGSGACAPSAETVNATLGERTP